MSHPQFKNRGNALGKLIEECGEVIAAAGKTVRFGWQSYNPLPGTSSETNSEWLRRELVDLEEAILRLRKSRGWHPRKLPREKADPAERILEAEG